MQHARNALPAHVHAEPDLGHPQMGVAGHDAKIQRHRQRDAAADAKTLDGADGDLLHLLPGAGEPRSQLQMPAQRADIHGAARASFGVLQVEPGAERLGTAGEHHDRSIAVVLKTARGIGELTQRLRRKRIDAVAAVEPHHGDAAFRPQAFFDVTKPRQDAFSLSAVSGDDSGEGSQRPCRFGEWRPRQRWTMRLFSPMTRP